MSAALAAMLGIPAEYRCQHCHRTAKRAVVSELAGGTDDAMRVLGWRIGVYDHGVSGLRRVEICPACAGGDPGYWCRIDGVPAEV